MTNISMNWRDNRKRRKDEIEQATENKKVSYSNEPFLLAPVGKDYLWGGSRLRDDFSKDISFDTLAETWECSTHQDGLSVVASGDFRGKTLLEVLKNHPEYMGTHHCTNGELPILIKFIDAKKDLSVQVHPDDAYARIHENSSLGKTEMWYVMDATKDAELVYGFYCDMDKEVLRRSLYDGTVERYLRRVPVKKGDVFFIPAGQVHAICAGVLIAEVQESSNITYRMYDYGRTDWEGQKRELHIEKALEVARLKRSSEPRQSMRKFSFVKGMATEFLCRCQYFQVNRIILNTERCKEMARIQTNRNSFQVLLCMDGCGVLYWNEKRLNFFKGDCIFVPADSVELRGHGRGEMLWVEGSGIYGSTMNIK